MFWLWMITCHWYTVSCFRNKTENSLWENHCDLHWGNQGQYWGNIKKKEANSLKKIEEEAKLSKVKRRSLEGWKLKAKENSKADLGWDFFLLQKHHWLKLWKLWICVKIGLSFQELYFPILFLLLLRWPGLPKMYSNKTLNSKQSPKKEIIKCEIQEN